MGVKHRMGVKQWTHCAARPIIPAGGPKAANWSDSERPKPKKPSAASAARSSSKASGPHRTPPICAQGLEGWAGFAAGDYGGEDLTPRGRDGGRRLSGSGRGPTVIDENALGTGRRRAWSRAPSLVAPWFAGGANANPGAGGNQRGPSRGNVAVANSALIGHLQPNDMVDAPRRHRPKVWPRRFCFIGRIAERSHGSGR